jgi:hypothetical protein
MIEVRNRSFHSPMWTRQSSFFVVLFWSLNSNYTPRGSFLNKDQRAEPRNVFMTEQRNSFADRFSEVEVMIISVDSQVRSGSS